MTQPVQDVIGMSYYCGSMGGSLQSTLHVCIDHLADGSMAQSLYTGAALVQPILRAARCVRGTLMMDGRICTASHYIAAWRRAQAEQPRRTLDAWFATHIISTTVALPEEGAKHAHWLSPVYWQASRHLFGSHPHGSCRAELRTVEDIRALIAVLQGRSAFGLAEQSLNSTLSVRARQHVQPLLALAA